MDAPAKYLKRVHGTHAVSKAPRYRVVPWMQICFFDFRMGSTRADGAFFVCATSTVERYRDSVCTGSICVNTMLKYREEPVMGASQIYLISELINFLGDFFGDFSG